MSTRPILTPWGKIEKCKKICPGVYDVETKRVDCIMVSEKEVKEILSAEATKYGNRFHGFLCYEKDCDANIVISELLEKGLYKIPTDYSETGFKSQLNESLITWHYEYWLKRQLLSKINENFQDFRSRVLKMDKNEILNKYIEIAAVCEVYALFEGSLLILSEINVCELLELEAPLQAIAQRWQKRDRNLCELDEKIAEVLASRDEPITEDSASEQKKDAKTSQSESSKENPSKVIEFPRRNNPDDK